jgi:hypothetical protein
LSTVASNGQLSPGAGPLGFTFYKPQPTITFLKGVSGSVSIPDWQWFEPETFTPSAGTGYEYPSYRVFSLPGAITNSNVEVLSISTDPIAERKIGSIIQKEVVKGLRISLTQSLKPISFPVKGARDLNVFIGIPSEIAKNSTWMEINLKAKVKQNGKTSEVGLKIQLSPGNGSLGI